MIAVVVTNAPTCYAVRQLTIVGELRGHEIEVVDYRDCIEHSFGNGVGSGPLVNSCSRFEVMFAWLDSFDLSPGLAAMREYEMSGVFSLNDANSLNRVCERVWLAQTLTSAGIDMPPAVAAHSHENGAALLDSLGDGPWMLNRLDRSHSCDQIIVAETRAAALLAVGHFQKLNRTFLVQRFIAEANQEDVRVLVVAGRAIAALLRRAKGSDVLPTWDSTATPAELTSYERRVAESAANALDLGIADVTLLRSGNGPLVQDVNPFPQIQWWDHHALQSVVYRLFELIELRTAGQ